MINSGKLCLLLFSPPFFIYSYTFHTYPEMRAAFWPLGWIMGGPLICIGSCHPLFFYMYVHVTHTHTHIRARTHTHTHAHAHTNRFTELYIHPQLYVHEHAKAYIYILTHHWCMTCTLRCYVCYPLYSMIP